MTEPKQWKPGDTAIADGYGRYIGKNEAAFFDSARVRIETLERPPYMVVRREAQERTAIIHVRNLSEPPKEEPVKVEKFNNFCLYPGCETRVATYCDEHVKKPSQPKEEPKPGTWACPYHTGPGPHEVHGTACRVYRATNPDETGPTWRPDTRKGERRVGKPRVIQVGEKVDRIITAQAVVTSVGLSGPSDYLIIGEGKVEILPLERRTAQGERRNGGVKWS